MDKPNQKSCFYCFEDINKGATVCTHCGKNQNQTKNNLIFISGTVGLITFTASAFVFLAGVIDAYIVRTHGADIQILNFSTLKQTTVLNNSTQNVILNKLYVNLFNGAQWQVILDAGLEAGEVGNYETGTLFASQSIGSWAVNFYPGSAIGLTLVEPSNSTEIKRLQKLIEAHDYTENTIEFINRDGSDFELYQKASEEKKPVEIECEAALTYTVVRGDEFTKKIDCVGLLRINSYEKRWDEIQAELKGALSDSNTELTLSDYIRRFISHTPNSFRK